MHHFERVSGHLVSRILRKSPSKSCSFNAIPTNPLKDSWDITLSYITELFNISLADQFKKAIIRPFLKKPHLDPEDYSNYRPIANLSFLSKTLERIVANQLNNYFVQNDRFPSFQSAYRSNHSTETALLRVVNDIQRSIDDHKEVILVLLDLSSAFDTLDHIILLGRLRDYYGISGTVLRWLETYLSERKLS